MLLSPRLLSFVLALSISSLTTLTVSFLAEIHHLKLLICFVIAFLITFVLIRLALEFLIFREVNKLYQSLNKLKKKDFKIAKKKLSTVSSPLLKLNDEIYKYAENKEKEIDQLMQVETFRREFLADVSHELKTPIFAAQGFIHTLLDGAKDDPEVRDKFLLRAAHSLDGIDHLVQDLIMLSNMQSGFINFDKEPVNVVHVIEEVLLQLENKARNRDVRILFDVEEDDADEDYIIKADNQRIRRVFINLIDNAIKYGNDFGHVFIDIKRVEDELIINIKDDGPGISKKHLTRIFERFYRVEKSRSKDRGGSGLGLAIVKQILDAHDATIEIQSKVNKGTTFTVKISVFKQDDLIDHSLES